MALKINGIEPWRILYAKNSVKIAFPNGTKKVQKVGSASDAYYTYTFSTSDATTFANNSQVFVKDVNITSYSSKEIHEIIDGDAHYVFRASFDDKTLNLFQTVRIAASSTDPEYITISGKDYVGSFYTERAINLDILKYGNIAVWGKPYSLTYTATGNGSDPAPTIVVNRTSSPNEHANTGQLSSGDQVYYGDMVTIQATPKYWPENYCIDPYIVNGVHYTSGETVTHTVHKDVTITVGLKDYSEPDITCVVETTTSGALTKNSYTVTITNPNNIYGSVSYEIFGTGDYSLKSGTEPLSPHETITITGIFYFSKNGMKVTADFQGDTPYGSKYSQLCVNNYESSTTSTTA